MSSSGERQTAGAARVLVVAGARPNFMKVAPLLRRMHERPEFAPLLVHTGQHYDAAMSGGFFKDLGIPEPDFNLGVGSGTHAQQTGRVLIKIEELIDQNRTDAVLVVGDVNSTLAATLAAVKLNVPVAHVEAGLRSGDREMPEEINRVMTDSVSTWLFVTEEAGRENLLKEGVPASKIHLVGNVMIDTLLHHLERARALDNVLEPLALEPRRYAVLTLHRPSNVDDPERLRSLFAALEELHQELPIVFPVHPRTRATMESQLGGATPKLKLTDPLGYLEFLRLMADSAVVLTDSGGIQEETTVLGVPCLTLRDNTERPVTLTEGTNTLVGRDPERIKQALREVVATGGKNGHTPALWDGQAADRILDVLASQMGDP